MKLLAKHGSAKSRAKRCAFIFLWLSFTVRYSTRSRKFAIVKRSTFQSLTRQINPAKFICREKIIVENHEQEKMTVKNGNFIDNCLFLRIAAKKMHGFMQLPI